MTESRVLRFDSFELVPGRRTLAKEGLRLALGPRAFDLLLALLQRRDRVVPKSELMDLVWPGLIVQENNLEVQISALRKLLGAQAIATVPGRGYQFTALVESDPDGSGSPDDASAAAAAARHDPPVERATRLPPLFERLHGRDDDVATLGGLVESQRLVTVLGAGGIGKSRLALSVAHGVVDRRHADVWWVELAGLSDPALVPDAVARALDIKFTGQCDPLQELVDAVAGRSALLVLDNCEHLIEAVARLVQALLQGAPGLAILATSQEPLRLPTERQFRISPLSVPALAASIGARDYGAVTLFEARARAMNPRFALTDTSLALVIDICHHLDGLPLAIELAAARVSALGLLPLRDKLGTRFKLLTGGSRVTLQRHQTLRATLEWSYNLLDDGERLVFRRLGVFAGGFTIELAQALAADEHQDAWAVLDHLSALVDKSLVVAESGDTPRYRLLESARAFALGQLSLAELATTRRRHGQALRAFCARIDGAHLDGEMTTEQFRALLAPEIDNVRAAWAWATGPDGEIVVALALSACTSALEEFAVESTGWLLSLQSVVEAGAMAPTLEARFWRAIASFNVSMTGRVPHARQEDAADRARTLYGALGQPRRAYSSLVQLAHFRLERRAMDAAQEAAGQARELVRPDWPAMLRVRLLRLEAHLARIAQRLPEALALHRQAVRVSASTGDWLVEMMARDNLADFLLQVGPMAQALHEARSLAADLSERPVEAQDMSETLARIMTILADDGAIEEACAVARDALALSPRGERLEVERWCYLFWRLQQRDVAAVLLGFTDARDTPGWNPGISNRRFVDRVRAGLQSEMPQALFEHAVAAGGAVEAGELPALIAAALASVGATPC